MAGSNAYGAGSSSLYKDPSVIGKIRHLKKEDGEPLWRVDIQYDFLRAIFDDDHCVFTNSYEPQKLPKQCFADLYIDTMARSSKTSKILHDKLLADREAAKNMAMVCLLVNIGRMNTTLNCEFHLHVKDNSILISVPTRWLTQIRLPVFPEMRAQLRTYHAIPSLQAYEKPLDYKQLQDAPRLKSILKGGTDDRSEPRSLDALKETDVPRTNPVNLLFLICNNAPKVAELHFPPGQEFHDLIMRTDLSSQSRATAFLWIVWFYLESDFTEEGCEENPFGSGVDYGVDVANQGVPRMTELSPKEEAEENIDSPTERAFGLSRKAFRAKLLQDEQFADIPPHKRNSRPSRPSVGATAAAKEAAAKEATAEATGTDNERFVPPAVLPRIRPSKHESDMESMRSTPPPRSLIRSFAGSAAGSSARRGGAKLSMEGGGPLPVRQSPLIQQLHQQQQIQQARRKRKQQRPERGGRSSRPHEDDDEDDDELGNTSVAPSRRLRPPTAHQLAVENNRKQRIDYVLSRGIHRKHHRARKLRQTEGAIVRALRRLKEVDEPFENSEDESNLEFNRGLFMFTMGAQQSMSTGNAFRERGFHGIVQLKSEPDDFGEETASYASAMRRACRRINRWETADVGNNLVVPTIKRPRVNILPVEDEYRDPNETEEEQDADPTDAADVSMSMSFAETPTPSTKKRRTVSTAAPLSAARARGGRSGRIPSNTPAAISARRRRAAKAAALNEMLQREAAAQEEGDATALGSGGEGDMADGDGDVDAADAMEKAAKVSVAPTGKPRVTIKNKGTGGSSTSTRIAKKVKVNEEDNDEAGGGDVHANHNHEDELNEVDKALLGMGSDSE